MTLASTDLLHRRALVMYIAGAFGFSYLIGVPYQLAVGSLAGTMPPLLSTYLPRVLFVAGPAVAALLLMWRGEGRGGVRRLLATLRPDPRHAAWWVAVPALGLAVATAAFAQAGVPLRTLLELYGSEGWLLAGHLALQLAIIGVGEELGWRGWLLPHLLQRRTRLGATALVALIWGPWHGPMLFAGVGVALPFVVIIVALTVLFTDLWSRVGGNVFVIALAHASVNTPIFFLEQLAYTGAIDESVVLTAWAWVAVGYGVLAACVLAVRGRWWLERAEQSVGA